MSPDSYTEVTRKSWGGRLGNAFSGILFGILLFVGSFIQLFWNEGRAVKTFKSLQEGEKTVISVPSDKVNESNNGKLVHMTGLATTADTLRDNDFHIVINAIKLQRNVEMFQWKQREESKTQKKLGGGEETVTTYTYEKVWADDAISSSNFKHPEGHQNPGAMRYENSQQAAQTVTLAAFTLSSSLAEKMSSFTDLTVSPDASLPSGVKPYGTGYYAGDNPGSPQIGDLKITFRIVRPAIVSVVAQQQGTMLAPYLTKVGKNLELLEMGTLGSDQMFQAAKAENSMFTWILRLVGFIAMFIGLTMVFKPLSVLGDVVPFIGSIIGFGTGFASFLLALILSIITIALAWIVYRPVVGISLLVVAAAGIAFMVTRKKKAKLAPSSSQ
jgi:hypothetical protein